MQLLESLINAFLGPFIDPNRVWSGSSEDTYEDIVLLIKVVTTCAMILIFFGFIAELIS